MVHIPIRTCAGTGQKLPQWQLLRFINVKGVPVPDPLRQAPGRGVYILPNAEALALAVKKKAFAHKLRTNRPPPSWQEIQAQLDTTAIKMQKAAELLNSDKPKD